MPKVADPYSVNETKKLVADRRPSTKARVLVLRAYSSRIVRSAGCVALALLLAATTSPTFGATTPRAIESLSVAEKASLPDTTVVKLKTGRTVSLGVLRSEHKLRLQRFAAAAKLGGLLQETKSEKRRHSGTLVPMNYSVTNFYPPGKLGDYPRPLPADFSAFCKAAAATACLYIPIAVYTTDYLNYWDWDGFITNGKLCQSEGGTLESGGCTYYYPNQYSLNFNPGKLTAKGYVPLTHSATCPSPFTYMVDPRGAVLLNAINFNPGGKIVPYGQINFTKLRSCTVRVFVKK